MLDNHVMIDGRVTDVRFNRLGKDGTSHTILKILIPANGTQSPVTSHTTFFGRTAEVAYEALGIDSHVFVSGWLQSRCLPGGLMVLNVVGERFRVLDSVSGINQVTLYGQVYGPPQIGHSRGKPYLRVQLMVGRDSYHARGDDTTDLVRVTMWESLVGNAVSWLSPGTTLLMQGYLSSYWRQKRVWREVYARQAIPIFLHEDGR